MKQKLSSPTPDSSPLHPLAAAALAVTIFVVDAFTPLDMAVAVLYVVVVLMAANFLDRRGLLLVSAGCLTATVVAYLMAHGLTMTTALGRCVMSVAAIAITAFLALQNQTASMGLLEQARLLDLTHDTILVRGMDDVITYWNRGAEERYGWPREQALGKTSHELMQTIFPAPLEEITAELLRTGQWGGELVHTKRDGTQLVVDSRWSLQRDRRGRPVAIMETNNDITERKAAEQRLRAAEQELRRTIDTIPALVYSTTPDGTPVFFSARWIEQGFSEQDLLSDWSIIVHPEDLPGIIEKRQRSLASGEPFEVEARLRRIDGDYRWFLIRAHFLRDASGQVVKRYGAATDIEDLKRAEDALRRSEALLAETQELTHTGSIGYDAATGAVFWSAEGARIFGYDPLTEPTLELLMQRVHPDDIWLARRWIEPANRDEPDDPFDIRLVMPEGSIKYVHAVSHAVGDVSARRALRALIDVTAAREADAALRRAQSELAHASRMTALGELTTSIAHEVNQPLAAIVTNGQACLRWLRRDVPVLDEARGTVTRIIADADRASEVIRRIRTLARKSDTKRAWLNLNDVIDEVILLVRHEVSSHRISLRRELASGLPPVLGDQVQLQQVLINLVVNAIQAMATVIDRPRELLIRSRMQEPDQLLIAVRDSGIGIAPEKMSQVFDTFFTTKADGMGMGLSICRSIIEAHGGQVWASSNDGPGVTFQFTLPSIQPSSP